MESNSIRKNLRLGLGISLFLLLISSIASFISIRNLIASSKMVAKSNEVILKLNDVLSALKDAETGQRGFLLTGNEVFLAPYLGSGQQAEDLIDTVRMAAADTSRMQELANELASVVKERRAYLQLGVDLRRKGSAVPSESLLAGKQMMDKARNIISQMKGIELELLAQRTVVMNQFSGFTPILIVFASLLSLAITIFFYRKISLDTDKRILLQKALIEKSEEMTNRINAIQKVASQISSGDYNLRLDSDDSDHLGTLSVSLNEMAESLQYSFTLLGDKEWSQTGVADINKAMVGEKSCAVLVKDVLETTSNHIESNVAAMYLLDENNHLKLEGYFSAEKERLKPFLEVGDGLIGQTFVSKKLTYLENVPTDELSISYATGAVKPKYVVALPVLRNGYSIGAMEFASLTEFSARDLQFLQQISELVGLGIHVAQNREKLQDLLEETQTQSEELQTQHSELESMNAELEAQTQRIQASEEELRVQQEELLQANKELEERSRMLEERNVVISERNSEIQAKAEQLELSTKYKSEFLANMSHELRTPLNSILLLSRLMADNEELDQEYVEYASVIQSSGQGLLTLIDEILDLSKIEAGKMTVEVASVELADVVTSMEQLFKPLTNEKNLELIVEVDRKLDRNFQTDRLRLEQILKNLLSNAIKFTATGRVKLKVFQDKNRISFEVSDTGIGIAQDKQSLIFEAFQQEDGSTRRRFGGTGLGLSISRELAKLLGGTIELHSKENVGSTFTLNLPLQMSVKPEIIEEREAVAEMPKPSSSIEELNIPNEIDDDRDNIKEGDQVILIIEDDINFAKILLDYTRKRNYKGVVAVRGDVGVDLALTLKPRAILLDIQLPVKNGWEVMEDLKSNSKTRAIPVHIMSSLEVKKESLRKGAVDFINKPFALEDLPKIFEKLELALSKNPKKILIVEENIQHANALAYFLSHNNISTSVVSNVDKSIEALMQKEIDCVILDMGIPDQNAYDTLETIKNIEGLENLPIIIFTGKNISKNDESKLKQYADSIVVKTAHSYQRILDEAGLFLHLVEEQEQETKGKKPKPSKFKNMHEILANKTILIADDDVRNIFSITKALEKHKINVIVATDGKEAIHKLQENNNIDLVLMDMMMPEMDGYQSTRAIRDIPEFRTLPIIAVTAKTMLGDREKCIAAGASDYISKPVDNDQLISLLRVWLYDKI